MKNRYKKGEALTAETVNRLLAAVQANTPRDGLGTRVIRGASGGFSIDITQPKSNARPAAASSHPWKVSIITVDGVKIPSIKEGKIYDGLNSIEEITPTLTPFTEAAMEDDVICIEYTYEDSTLKNVIVTADDFTPFTDDEEDPPVLLTSRWPLAKIINTAESAEAVLGVQQMASSDVAQVSVCVDGTIIKGYAPL